MSELKQPFAHVKGVLDAEDLAFLKTACKTQLEEENIPCFALIDSLQSSTYLKVKAQVEAAVNQKVNYLNDFYMYTDASFSTGWHMDTELYTFEDAVNAWILLSPNEVPSPLGLIDGINDSKDDYYHTVTIKDGECQFGNLSTGESEARPLEKVEAGMIACPDISVGDILLFNPRRYHRTNTDHAKHCHVIKFVFGSDASCLSQTQVDPFFWPEVEIFNGLVKGQKDWTGVVNGIRDALKSDDGKKSLSAGFYPQKFSFYKEYSKRL